MLPDSATSHRQVTAWRTQLYFDGLRDGKHQPFAVSLLACTSLLLLLYMLVPALKGPAARYGTFGLVVAVQAYVVPTCRTANTTAGLVIGLLGSWNVVWAAVLLIFNDTKRRAKKVMRVPPKASGSSSTPATYQWQSYPADDFNARLPWAADLVFNSRGMAWDWKVSATPSRPPPVEASLRGIDLTRAIEEDHPRTSAGRFRFETRSQALLHHARIILQGYLLLDLLKTVMNHDPYYWGLVDQPPPASFPSVITSSPVITRVYRCVVCVAFFASTLQTMFSFIPLVFLGLFSPDVAGPTGEAWLYPVEYGSYKTVLTRGLAGFWGGWWHQVFRYGFQSAARWLTVTVLGLKPKSQAAAVIELHTSFALSGFMHAAGSITMLGSTRPWTNMFLFFALQPAGILIEIVTAHLVGRTKVGRRVPKSLVWTLHFVYAHAWLYLTGPLLTDDLARGGMLLFEPVPFSPLRGLGFGTPGDGFYCWGEATTTWHWDAKRPWLSGLVF